MAASSGPGYNSLKRDNGNGDPPSCKRLPSDFRREDPNDFRLWSIFSHHPSMYDNIVVSSKSIHGTLGRFWEERILYMSPPFSDLFSSGFQDVIFPHPQVLHLVNLSKPPKP